MIEHVVILIFLTSLTYFDVKTKRLPLRLVIGFGLFIILTCLVNGHFESWEVLIRMMPGIFLLMIAFITKEAIGYGDGFVILLIGLMLDIQISIRFILIALLLSALASISLLFLKKGDRQTRIPFIPFLLMAWCIYIF